MGYDDKLWIYNCDDTIITLEVQEALESAIEKLNLQSPNNFQQELFDAVLLMMLRGVRFDIANRDSFEVLLAEELSKREEWFKRVLGHPLNPRSPKQMGQLFYQDFAQKIIKNPKAKGPSLDDSALTTIAEREPLLKPLIRKILEHRSIGVFLSTFVRMPLDSDNRMRCFYNIGGTETYRFSSRENAFGTGGNLANIPKGGQDDDSDLELPNIRSLFIPDPSYTMFDIDLSKADLRIVTWEADVQEMKAMLREGKDPYIELAREFFRDPTISKTRSDGTDNPRYKQFKSAAHGMHYLGSAKGLAGRLGLSVAEMERLQKWYFEKYPGIKAYQDRILRDINTKRYVENVFGYRWYAFDRVDNRTYRQAAAFIPQSTVAIIINHGMVNIHNNFKEAQCLLQVHDSLVGQYPTHLGDTAKNQILKECSITLPYNDPLVVPAGIKTSVKNWGECS